MNMSDVKQLVKHYSRQSTLRLILGIGYVCVGGCLIYDAGKYKTMQWLGEGVLEGKIK